MSDTMTAVRTVEIVIPWVPDQACNPNNHTVSERTRIRHRKKGVEAGEYPFKIAGWNRGPNTGRAVRSDSAGFIFHCPVALDITVRWGYRQKSWDSDNLVTAMKYVRDALQTYGIVKDDRLVRIGNVIQERAGDGQPETVLTVREVSA